MMRLWLQALAEVDDVLASALIRFETAGSIPPEVAQEESSELVLGWLAQQMPMPNMLVISGVSQVDLIEPLLERKKAVRLLLIEPDPERLSMALNGVDSPVLAEAIRTRRLLPDLGESKEQAVERFLVAADFSRVPVIRLLEARPLSDGDLNQAIEMTREAREFIRLQNCDISTRNRFGPAWQANTLLNVPQILNQGRIKSLFGQFSGIPAVVVAAGPSLKDAIPALARIRHRVVVIAVGRVMSTLIYRMGIVPDLLVTGDGQDLVVKQFTRKPVGLPVVASCFSDAELIQNLDCVFFAEMMAMGLPEWMEHAFGSVGEIHPGGNVATAAISTAVELGCNPVMTAGFDLSYPDDGVTHVTGGLKTEQRLYEVQGNYQPRVKTNRQMWHYINFAQEYIEQHPEVSFVNVNTAGAHIEGMQLILPDQAESLIPEKPVNAASRIERIYKQTLGEVDSVGCAERLRDDAERLRSLSAQCISAAMTSNQMLMLMRCPGLTPNAEEEFHKLIDGLQPVDERLKTDPVMKLLETRLETVSRGLAERMMTDEERAQPPAIRSHRHWREFYKGVSKACQTTEKLLQTAIRRLEEEGVARVGEKTDELRIMQTKGE